MRILSSVSPSALPATDATIAPATTPDAPIAPAPATGASVKPVKRAKRAKPTKPATTPDATAPEATKPAPAFAPDATIAEATIAEAPRHPHIAAGLNPGLYAGSSYVNAMRKTAIPIGVARYNVTADAVFSSDRQLPALRALHLAYGASKSSFLARGFDNALLARFLNSGLVSRVPGTGREYTDSNGVRYLGDGPEPLRLVLTDAAYARFSSVTATPRK